MRNGIGPNLQFLRGKSNYMLGRYDESIQDLSDALDTTSKMTLAQNTWIIARCYVSMKEPSFVDAIDMLNAPIFDEYFKLKIPTRIDSSFIYSCRQDTKNRDGKLALEFLDSVRSDPYLDYYIVDFTLADALANLEAGQFDKASKCFNDLKTITTVAH